MVRNKNIYKELAITSFDMLSESQKNIIHFFKKHSHPCLLIYGSPGNGKTTFTGIMARYINCLEANPGEETCRCYNCAHTHYHYKIYNSSFYGSVSTVRELMDHELSLYSKKYIKFLCFDEGHMLSSATQNLLLREIEVASSQIKFIIVTTNIGSIIQALKSRAYIMNFENPSIELKAQFLDFVIKKMNLDVLDQEKRTMLSTIDRPGVSYRDVISTAFRDTESSPMDIPSLVNVIINPMYAHEQKLATCNQITNNEVPAILAELISVAAYTNNSKLSKILLSYYNKVVDTESLKLLIVLISDNTP